MSDILSLAAALSDLTRRQQINADIVRSLCDSIRDEVIAAVPHMPAGWDGHEVRKYLADKFKHEVRGTAMTGKRLRQYERTVAVTPGL